MNHAGQAIHPNSMGRANEHREAMCPSRPFYEHSHHLHLSHFLLLMGFVAPLQKKSSHAEPHT